ncbi:MAG TPA: cupredoxin family copper-binding protein [Casimicrobiaceae bacterium]|nr:cupredoxin family copper-binding protein [Casimicrobiaceae bacterium]
MRRPVIALLCVCAVVSVPGGALGAGAAAKPVTHRVVIDGLKYEPEALTVKRGDTIVWTNKDPFPHTVTAPGKFDSHDIAAGASWKYVARSAGQYDYICTLHPNMKGTLRVE